MEPVGDQVHGQRRRSGRIGRFESLPLPEIFAG